MLEETMENVLDDLEDEELKTEELTEELTEEFEEIKNDLDLTGEEVDDSDFTAVAVDWMEFEGALENNSPELKSYLNVVTGDVIRVFQGSDKPPTDPETDEDYLLIDPISSREQYHWMEEFIETVADAPLKEKLNIAIDGKGAFRRFKDVLMGYPAERERWFTKRSSKLHTHMIEWIKVKRIKPGNIPPWDAAYDQSRRFEEKRTRTEAGTGGWREGQTDLRAVCRDLIDVIPSRELPTAAAFLEFLRGRRGFRRPNHS